MRLVLLYLVVPALTLAFRSVPDTVDNHDIVPDVPHVRRHDLASYVTEFLDGFEAPLANVGA